MFHLESHPLTKGSPLRAAFLSSCLKPSAEDQHTDRLYPVYSDDLNSNDTKRKENERNKESLWEGNMNF